MTVEATEPLVPVRLQVNGVSRTVDVPGRRLLSDVLRHDLRLTGTHVGCEHGVCGACTVLMDGDPVRSCLILAASADGHSITTVEGLADADGTLHPVQQAFVDCHGLQCGFCTPGFVTTIAAYLRENPDPSEDDALEAVSGNLCRCTGYQNIRAAVLRAAELTRERAGSGSAGSGSAGSGSAGCGSAGCGSAGCGSAGSQSAGPQRAHSQPAASERASSDRGAPDGASSGHGGSE